MTSPAVRCWSPPFVKRFTSVQVLSLSFFTQLFPITTDCCYVHGPLVSEIHGMCHSSTLILQGLLFGFLMFIGFSLSFHFFVKSLYLSLVFFPTACALYKPWSQPWKEKTKLKVEKYCLMRIYTTLHRVWLQNFGVSCILYCSVAAFFIAVLRLLAC